MLTTIELIEMIREKNGNCSDYRLAKLINVTPQTIHNYTKRNGHINDESAIIAAEMLGIPPFYILACIQAEKSQNERICHILESMAAEFLPANFAGLMIQQKMAV